MLKLAKGTIHQSGKEAILALLEGASESRAVPEEPSKEPAVLEKAEKEPAVVEQGPLSPRSPRARRVVKRVTSRVTDEDDGHVEVLTPRGRHSYKREVHLEDMEGMNVLDGVEELLATEATIEH